MSLNCDISSVQDDHPNWILVKNLLNKDTGTWVEEKNIRKKTKDQP